MEDIYNILSKHFLQEATKDEELQVSKFKDENKIEYKLLKELWERNDVKVKDFDTQKALATIKNKVKNKKGKTIPLNRKIIKIAAAILFATLIIKGVFSTFEIFNSNNIVIENKDNSVKGKLIKLSDGTKIWLNKDATIKYPKHFNNTIRNVKLEGEAFFEVAKNPNKPFFVTCSNSTIIVLGTSFNINATKKNNTEVTVATGKVSVNNKHKKSVIITPGFSAKVTNKGLEKFETKNVNYLSWKTGKFIFKEADLRQVVSDLNSFYETKIIIKEETKDCKFTSEFDNLKIEEIVEILQLSCNIKITKNRNVYTIK